MKKILIADDEASLRFLISEILKINEYEIYEADNGTLALELANRIAPDLLILDVKMPGMSGYEVVKEYKKSGHNAKIIMLTAEDKSRDKDAGYSSGTDYYMIKPFNPYDLLDLVEDVLK